MELYIMPNCNVNYIFGSDLFYIPLQGILIMLYLKVIQGICMREKLLGQKFWRSKLFSLR